ncbi:MAG: hypothetical protein WAS56_13665 [Saprospiraceae bacterium]
MIKLNLIFITGAANLVVPSLSLMMKKVVLVSILAIVFFSRLFAQEIIEKPIASFIGIDINYGFGLPLADLKSRYGQHLIVGSDLIFQPKSTKWAIGLSGHYGFGNNVKEDVVSAFRTQHEGLLIGSDGFLAEVKLKERVYIAQVWLGTIVPLGSQRSARHGIRIKCGLGYFKHFIKILDESRSLPQFNDEYIKGLDRRTGGILISNFTGYEYLDNKNRICFYVGVEPMWGLGKSLANVQYDTNPYNGLSSRNDVLLNFKAGWIIPLIKIRKSDEIEY